MQSGDLHGAEQCFRQAIAMQPGFGEALANLGHLRSKAGDTQAAESFYRQALAARPALEEAYLMLGVLLMNQKRFSESEQLYRYYLQHNPQSPAAWSNLGVLLACLKRETEAEQCYRTALSMDNNFKKASFNLSYILLRQERWEEGWRCLEDRWPYPVLAGHFTCPRWCGEVLQDKSIIIGFEMGHGDMIFYCRYISELKKRGASRISLICHPGLTQLFKTLSGVDEVFSFNDVVPASGWDYWTPPMSLPHYCQTSAGNFPTPIPYLHAEAAKIAYWKNVLPNDGLRVGLVWKGLALFENDADRSIQSLKVLEPLGAVAGVHFISLQKGQGEDEALNPPAGLALQALGAQLNDFADTAAVIRCLDLVISVDTAVAHLAGAMGVPCWLLLPDYRPDWRWLTERTDTPWYPQQMRLFRQSTEGGWASVIDMVSAALEEWQVSKQL